MKLNVNSLGERIIWIGITLYFALIPLASIITEDSGMGKYVLLAPLLMMLFAKILLTNGKLAFRLTQYEGYILVFAIFCYVSALWALNPSYAVSKATNTIEVLVTMFLIRICLPEQNRIRNLLKCVMWGSFIIIYYAILRYGWEYVIYTITSDTRMESTIINANTVGMGAAFAILISLYFLVYEGLHLGLIFSVPAFIVLTASGSRKALLILVLGILGLFILKNIDKKNIALSILKVFFTIIVVAVVTYQVAQLPMFGGITERIQGLISGVLGNGNVDHSTSVRLKMIEIGIELFRNNPFVGVGIDNAKIYTEPVFGIANYYLHNNYVELLADGGVIGLYVYYSIYVGLLIKFWKNRNFHSGEFNIVFVILILRLILDYGMVSYESKSTYFYLLIFFLEAIKLAEEKCNERTTPVISRLGNMEQSIYQYP